MDAIQKIEDRIQAVARFNDGTEQSIDVIKVPIRKLRELVIAMSEGEFDELALYINRPDAFLDQLTDDSVGELLSKGRDLNANAVKKFVARQRDLDNRLRDLADEN